jgi:hypothetical protein
MPPYQSVHMRVCSYGEGYETCTRCAYGAMWVGTVGSSKVGLTRTTTYFLGLLPGHGAGLGWVDQDRYLFIGLTFWAWA